MRSSLINFKKFNFIHFNMIRDKSSFPCNKNFKSEKDFLSFTKEKKNLNFFSKQN